MKTTYAVIALFNEESTRKFNNLKRSISVEIKDDYSAIPHITLAVYDKLFALNDLIAWTKDVAGRHSAFKLFFPAVGVMHGYCLVALPVSSSKLIALHRDCHQKYDGFCVEYSKLCTDTWLPHTGIAYVNKDFALEKIAPLVAGFQPFEAEVISLCVTTCVRSDDSYEIKSAAKFDLMA